MPDDQNHPAQTAGQPAPQAEPTASQRDSFETWARAWRPKAGLAWNRHGNYVNSATQHLWECWQAAQAGAVQPAADALTDALLSEIWLGLAGKCSYAEIRYVIERANRGTAPKAAEPPAGLSSEDTTP